MVIAFCNTTKSWLKVRPPPAVFIMAQRNYTLAYERLHKGRQLRKLLGACLIRWVLTLTLCVSIYVVLWHYSSKLTMVEIKKKEFTTLIIGLSIMLSLNLASSLKHMVSTLRWWVLSLTEWTPREVGLRIATELARNPTPPPTFFLNTFQVDLILQSDHPGRMIQLMQISRRFSIRVYVFLWAFIIVVIGNFHTQSRFALHLLLCQAAQIALAMLGLTYNINGANKIAPTTPGIVSISNLTDLQTQRIVSSHARSKSRVLSAARFTANRWALLEETKAYDSRSSTKSVPS